MHARAVVAFVLLAAALGLPRSASAWCRTTTNGDFVETSAKPCDDQGAPVWWGTSCVDLAVNRQASAQIDLESARKVVRDAFGAWASVRCPSDPVACTGEDRGNPSIAVREVGPTECGAGFQRGRSNANVVIFYDGGWPYDDATSTLALTTVTYRLDDGRILDADIEVNSDPTIFSYTADEPDRDEYDLLSIMTHEAGHFLGLAHTQPQNVESTMAPRYMAGTSFMRTPTSDDACGLCAAASPRRNVACNPQTPGACLPGAVGPYTEEEASRCAVAHPGRSIGAFGALLGLLVAASICARRRSTKTW